MISLIVTFNEKSSYHSFLSNLSTSLKKTKSVEIIFILQIGKKTKISSAIEKFEKENKNVKTKIMYSLKNISFNNQIFYAHSLVENEFVYLLDSNTILEKNFFQIIEKYINKYNNSSSKKKIDVIEFNLKLKGLTKWRPKARLESKITNTLLETKKENSIIAFSFPFIFNKIISKKSLSYFYDKAKNFDSKKDSSTIFSILLNYSILLNSNNYCFIDEQLVTFNIDSNTIINYNDLIQEWELIKNIYLQENKYIEEMKYAKLFYLQIFLPGIYGKTHIVNKLIPKRKINLLQKKYFDKLSKIRNSEFEFFDVENKYMNVLTKKESILLKKIIPINDWTKLFDLLEK